MSVPVDRMQEIITEGRYAISGILGRGSVGTVYRARDRVLEREVALKVLRKPYAGSGKIAERFRQGVKGAASLSHPNIVPIYDSIEPEENLSYIAMQYLRGGTLADRLDHAVPLEADEAARLALDVANALDEGHRRGISHGNLHSRNVLLAEDGQAKVADFGFADAADRSGEYDGSDSGESGAARDLRSLGVLLYGMLTGDIHAQPDASRPSEKNPLVPAELDALALALLAGDPAARPASAGQVAERLEQFLGDTVPGVPEYALEIDESRGAPRLRERAAVTGAALRARWRLAAALVCASLVFVLAGLAVLGTPLYGLDVGSAGEPLAPVLEPRAAAVETQDLVAAKPPADASDEPDAENARGDERNSPEESEPSRKDPDEPPSERPDPEVQDPEVPDPAVNVSEATASASSAPLSASSVNSSPASASSNTASATSESSNTASSSAVASASPAPQASVAASASPAPTPSASASSESSASPRPAPQRATAAPVPEPVRVSRSVSVKKVSRPAPVERRPVQPRAEPAPVREPERLPIPAVDVPEIRIGTGLPDPGSSLGRPGVAR